MARNPTLTHRPTPPRVALACLVLCCVLVLQPCFTDAAEATVTGGRAKHRGATSPASAARVLVAHSAGLPDLNKARRGETDNRRALSAPPKGAPRPSVQAAATDDSFASAALRSLLTLVTAPAVRTAAHDGRAPGGPEVAGALGSPRPSSAAWFIDAPSGLHVTQVSGTQITLNWSPAAGAPGYRVERSLSKDGPYQPVGTSASVGFNDAGVTNGKAYLYRVCASGGAGTCVSPYSNNALGAAYTFTDDPLITAAEDPSGQSVTRVKALHVTQLRGAVNAVRALVPGLGEASWTNPQLTPHLSPIKADDVRDLRAGLGEALTALGMPAPAYTDATLRGSQQSGQQATPIRRAHIAELRLAVTRAQGAPNSGGSVLDFDTTRLDPDQRTGGQGADPYSRNYNWSIPLLELRGRAGLDLSLTLSYNTLVWTKDSTGAMVTFDADRGFPAPGFRLGFPTLNPSFFNARTGKQTYLLITPSGQRVELRGTDSPGVYESADSSFLQLRENGATLELRTTDGTLMTFHLAGGQYRCHQAKDRDGNYISAAYHADGRLDKVFDTLGRTIAFNYDSNQRLTSITQPWRRETAAAPSPTEDETHSWAEFWYSAKQLGPNSGLFAGPSVIGVQGGTSVSVLSRVRLGDGSHFKFEYNDWGQAWKATHYAADSVDAQGQPDDSHALAQTRLDLPGSDLEAATPQTDCPRFSEERTWIEYGVMNQSEEVVTSYSPWAPDMESCEVTVPDGTVYKSTYATAAANWRRGLTTSAEVRSGGQVVKSMSLVWKHDGAEGDAHQINPRVEQVTLSDSEGNQRATRIEYTSAAEFRLPKKVEECNADCSQVLRTTVTDYNIPNLNQYVAPERRIVGLPHFIYVYEGAALPASLRSQVEYVYDAPNDAGDVFLASLPSSAAQHDYAAYNHEFRLRGHLNRVRRYAVDQQTGAVGAYVESRIAHNVTGGVASFKDPAGHQTVISYADAFFMNVNRTHADPQYRLLTFAYPTAVTVVESAPTSQSITSSTRYNYDMGVVTQATDPKLAVFKTLHDAAGRVERVTRRDGVSGVDVGYTRWVYAPSLELVQSYTQTDAGETYAASVLDGAGRVRAAARDLPHSAGGYAGQLFDFDIMGRLARQSNPTETSAAPAAPTAAPPAAGSWPATGDDLPENEGYGWLYTSTTYDWQGRPRVTTNADGTTREVSYAGCGCAGGEVVTLKGELVPIAGTASQGRRTRKVYHDAYGRAFKAELLNWDGAVYTTTTTKYDGLDRAVRVRHYDGLAPSPEPEADGAGYQTTLMSYDGHGRLRSRKAPEATQPTSFTYNADDTLRTRTDGRGAVSTYEYNDRHLATRVTHALGNEEIVVTADYDVAGNRERMTDSLGSVIYEFDTLSRLRNEKRSFNALSHPNSPYTLTYTYTPDDQLKTVTDPFGAQFTYGYDGAGRLEQVTGSAYAGVTSYATGIRYRAWGAIKGATFVGNNASQTTTFDRRLRPSKYRLASGFAGHLQREDFSYFADGRLQAVVDLDDGEGNNPPATLHFMSRAYTYDHVGRVLQGGSVSPSSSPFRQTYQYDAFDNLTARSGGYGYTGSWQSETAAYTNHRRQGWDYDEDGRLKVSPATTTSTTRTWTHNAAGLQTRVVESVTGGANTLTTAYDGDGRSVYETASGQSIQNSTHYMVRSSVLGGEVLTRLDQTGGKSYTYVPAGGVVRPRQVRSNGSEWVAWTHMDPVGVSEVGASYDPLGNYVSHTPPPSPGPPPPVGVYGPSYGGAAWSFHNGNNYATGCMLDGRPTSCDRVAHELSTGSAVVGANSPSQMPGVGGAGGGIVSLGSYRVGVVGYWTNPETGRRIPREGRIWSNEFFAPGSQFGDGLPSAGTGATPEPQRNRRNDEVTLFDPEKFAQCLKDLFSVHVKELDTAPEPFYGYERSRKRILFSGTYRDQHILVTTDMTRYTSSQMPVASGHPPGTRVGGFTPANNPKENYVASDVARNAPMDLVIAAWVHELGNSLSYITGLKARARIPNLLDWDKDAGMALEECVYRGKVVPTPDGSATITKNPKGLK